MLRPPPLSSLHHCKADNLLTYRSEKENELVMKKRNQIFVCLAVILVFLLCMRLCAAEETANVIVAGRHTVSLEQAQQEVDDLIAAYRNTYSRLRGQWQQHRCDVALDIRLPQEPHPPRRAHDFRRKYHCPLGW